MEVRERHEGDVIIIRPVGRIDATTTQAFSDHVKQRIVDGARKVVLDLYHIDFMSSAGLRMLNILKAVMKSYKGEIVICSPSDNLMELFQLVSLGNIYHIFHTVEAALKKLLDDAYYHLPRNSDMILESRITLPTNEY
ncbi:MAG: anti-sigma factor antagonist [Candidatus Omnitrophota bacterium]|nr:MAG: anti-sigma factor antagonist [Candidatus Omnitrophota bacterium]